MLLKKSPYYTDNIDFFSLLAWSPSLLMTYNYEKIFYDNDDDLDEDEDEDDDDDDDADADDDDDDDMISSPQRIAFETYKKSS